MVQLMRMLVNFGHGKCPLCGDFGRELEKRTFHCRKCDIAFDKFFILHADEAKEYYAKYWN